MLKAVPGSSCLILIIHLCWFYRHDLILLAAQKYLATFNSVSKNHIADMKNKISSRTCLRSDDSARILNSNFVEKVQLVMWWSLEIHQVSCHIITVVSFMPIFFCLNNYYYIHNLVKWTGSIEVWDRSTSTIPSCFLAFLSNPYSFLKISTPNVVIELFISSLLEWLYYYGDSTIRMAAPSAGYCTITHWLEFNNEGWLIY